MIVSIMDKSAGFYSTLFFMISQYIHAKKTGQSFRLITSTWLYKSVNGWTDYFEPIDFNSDKNNSMIKQYRHNQVPEHYFIYEYKNAIDEMYIYNQTIKTEIVKMKTFLELTDLEYDAIYIRHGDKLCSESKYIAAHKYMELLLQKNPECKTVLVQTDDYNAFLDIQKYVDENHLNIRVITTCDKNCRGFIVYNKYTQELVDAYDNNAHNKEYLATVKPILDKTKPIEQYTPDEIKQHTTDLLVGVDLVLKSKFCVLDYQSNVSRFIMIAHNDYTKAFDVRYPTENICMTWTSPPPYW